MRILFINTLYHPYIGGGAEIIVQEQAAGLQRKGHDVVVLTTGPEPGLREEMIDGVRVIRAGLDNIYWHFYSSIAPLWRKGIWHIRDIYNIQMARVVRRVVESERPDVVSCHNMAGWSASAWSAIRHTGTPIVHVLHDLYLLCPNSNMFRDNAPCARQCGRCKGFRLRHPRLSESVDAVVGVSQFVLDRHLEYGYFGNVTIRKTIHNARQVKVNGQVSAENTGSGTRFGFIGTLAQAKGIELLLESFEQLDNPQAELLVAGSGKEKYEKSLRLRYRNPRIRFLGYTKPQDFFPEIDALVVPSRWHDTLPGVVFESLAFGVPVIGSRRGGIPEMIEDGRNGFLFNPENTSELKRCMTDIIRHPQVIQRMRGSARSSATPFTDVDSWLDAYEELYVEVAERNKSQRVGKGT